MRLAKSVCLHLQTLAFTVECLALSSGCTGACSFTCAVPCCAVRCCAVSPVQVGESLDIEILRGNSKEHVSAVLEPNA
jgi:hypothetical protein